MLGTIFPPALDNEYRGSRIALWLVALVLLLRSLMGINSIVIGYRVASGADGIPLDTFSTAAVQTVLALFAILGLGHLLVCVAGGLVLWRYRSATPLYFLLLLTEHLARKLILLAHPIPRNGHNPSLIINLILIAMLAAGLVLSLRTRRGTVAAPLAAQPR